MVIEKSELADLRTDVGSASIALRLGSYDLLHAGHQAGIDFAAEQADILVLGVMSDEYISTRKGPDRPINPEARRAEAIDQAEGVSYTFIAPANTLAVAGTLVRLRPEVYVEGQEHSKTGMKALFLGGLGIKYVIDRQPIIESTSEMIDRLGLQEAMARSSLGFKFDRA